MKKTLWIMICMVLLLQACSKRESSLVLRDAEDIVVESQNSEQVEDNATRPIPEITVDDVITIMVRADGAPGMYLGEDGEVHGFYVDLERIVMEEMGQAYEFSAYFDLGPIIQRIKSGTVHSALAAFDLPAYRSVSDLSIPFERLNFVTFVEENNQDIGGNTVEEIIESLHGKKVGVQTQGHIYQVLVEVKEIELLEYPTTTQALEALAAGELDAVPDVERIGRYYSQLNGWNIKPVGEPIISHVVCTGFSQVIDPGLLERYNTALAKVLEDGRYDRLYEEYFGPIGPEDRP